MRALKIIGWSTYLQTLSFLRVKEALFFALIFPLLLFVMFGFIWGTTEGGAYTAFLLTGIIGMTIANDAIYGVGPVIKNLRGSNLLKMLRCTPMPVLYHFTGLIVSRMVVMLVTIGLLLILAAVIFGYLPSGSEFGLIGLGIVVGTAVFSLLSLVLTLAGSKYGDGAVLNLVFFVMLFLSGAFFPIEEGTWLGKFASTLPLTHLVGYLRGDTSWLPALLAWTVAGAFLFSVAFRRHEIKR
jgi:ABC-type multidrug transport system permease subunit